MYQPNMALRHVLESDDFVIYSYSDRTSSNGQHQIMQFDAKFGAESTDETLASQFIKNILRDYYDSHRLVRFDKFAKPQSRWQTMFVIPMFDNDTRAHANDEVPCTMLQQQQHSTQSELVEEKSPPAPVSQESSRWRGDSDEDGEEEYADVDKRDDMKQEQPPPPKTGSVEDPRISTTQQPPAPPQPFESGNGHDLRRGARSCSGIAVNGGNGGRAQRTRRPTMKTTVAQNRQNEIDNVRKQASTVMEWQNAYKEQHSRMPRPAEIQQHFRITPVAYKKVATRIAYVKKSAAAAQRANEVQEARDKRRRRQSEPSSKTGPVSELAAAMAERLAVVLPDSHSHQGGVFSMASMGGGDVPMAE